MQGSFCLATLVLISQRIMRGNNSYIIVITASTRGLRLVGYNMPHVTDRVSNRSGIDLQSIWRSHGFLWRTDEFSSLSSSWLLGARISRDLNRFRKFPIPGYFLLLVLFTFWYLPARCWAQCDLKILVFWFYQHQNDLSEFSTALHDCVVRFRIFLYFLLLDVWFTWRSA